MTSYAGEDSPRPAHEVAATEWTLAQPAPELNPINMEHRVTVLEQAQLRTTEQIGNTSLAVDKLLTALGKQEELAAARDANQQTQIDDIVTGITRRREMDSERASGYEAGRASVELKLPVRQMVAIMIGLGGVASGIGAIFALIIQLR